MLYMPYIIITMINETAEKITLLFYKLWTSKGIVTNEAISIRVDDNKVDFKCDDKYLKQALLEITNDDIVLLKNSLTFMLQKDIITCHTKQTLDGMLNFCDIGINHKAIEMVKNNIIKLLH